MTAQISSPKSASAAQSGIDAAAGTHSEFGCVLITIPEVTRANSNQSGYSYAQFGTA
jgi:hypothetical protein